MKVSGDKIKRALKGAKHMQKGGADRLPTEEDTIEGFETGSPPPHPHEIVNVQPPYSPPSMRDATSNRDIENRGENGNTYDRDVHSSKSLDKMEEQEFGMRRHVDANGTIGTNTNGIIVNNGQITNFPIVAVPVKMQADLAFTRVKYLSIDGVDDRPDMVLHGISGRVIPGTACCILTGSADKSGDILLRVLSGRYGAIGSMLGSITVNDGPMVLADNLNSDGSFKSHRCTQNELTVHISFEETVNCGHT